MYKSKKILIVGAGPAGCYLGQLLKKKHYCVEIIEEHSEIGKPIACAGIVGVNIFNEAKIPLPKSSILNVLNGAVIYYNEESFVLKRKTAAYVVDRSLFDSGLSLGLNVHLGTKLLDFKKQTSKDGYLIETSCGQYSADIIVGSDGPNSVVREIAGLGISKKDFCWGAQYRIKITDPSFKPDMVEVHFYKPFSSFSWIVPEGADIFRVGSISDKPMENIRDILQRRKIKGDIIDKVGGIIPIGFCNSSADNVALLGDAACQVKPLSGGGIYFGIKAAEILAQAIFDGKLADYDKNWKKLFGNEIKIGLKAKEIIGNLSPKTLASIFNFLKDNSAVIEEVSDFERHSSVILEFAKNPRAYQIVGNILWDFLKAI